MMYRFYDTGSMQFGLTLLKMLLRKKSYQCVASTLDLISTSFIGLAKCNVLGKEQVTFVVGIACVKDMHIDRTQKFVELSGFLFEILLVKYLLLEV